MQEQDQQSCTYFHIRIGLGYCNMPLLHIAHHTHLFKFNETFEMLTYKSICFFNNVSGFEY